MNVVLLLLLGSGIVAALVAGSDALALLQSGAAAAVDTVLRMSGVYLLWMGLLNIAERAGVMRALSRALRPALKRLFPDAGRAEEAISMNLAANMLGMGNAATPYGLKAMRLLNESNPRPGVATDAMCVLLCINASCLELYPASLVGLRQSFGSETPYAVVVPTLLSSLLSTVSAVVLCRICCSRS